MSKLKKIDFYWSDRWWRVIGVYRCANCLKEMTNLRMKRPDLEISHVCGAKVVDEGNSAEVGDASRR